jgi:hypothetical protein
MIRKAFGVSFFILAGIALAIGVLVYVGFGWNGVVESMLADIPLILRIIPNIGASVLIAAFVHELMPAQLLTRYVGEESGAKGIAISAAAGVATPGGPMTSFAFVTVLKSGGTGASQLVAYLTSWSTMGLQRVIAWELPLMGPGFAILRIICSLPLPFIAAFVAGRLPFTKPATDGAEQP